VEREAAINSSRANTRAFITLLRFLSDSTLRRASTEEQRGDPRFLDVARGAMADVRRLLGLERVTVEHTHQTDRPAADLTDAELDVKLAEFALEHQRKAGGGDRPH
jgi:hypothetical protein